MGKSSADSDITFSGGELSGEEGEDWRRASLVRAAEWDGLLDRTPPRAEIYASNTDLSWALNALTLE